MGNLAPTAMRGAATPQSAAPSRSQAKPGIPAHQQTLLEADDSDRHKQLTANVQKPTRRVGLETFRLHVACCHHKDQSDIWTCMLQSKRLGLNPRARHPRAPASPTGSHKPPAPAAEPQPHPATTLPPATAAGACGCSTGRHPCCAQPELQLVGRPGAQLLHPAWGRPVGQEQCGSPCVSCVRTAVEKRPTAEPAYDIVLLYVLLGYYCMHAPKRCMDHETRPMDTVDLRAAQGPVHANTGPGATKCRAVPTCMFQRSASTRSAGSAPSSATHPACPKP